MKHSRKKLTAALLLFLLLAAGAAAYAKYYSQSAKAGIAIASGVYFASNYLGSTADGNTFLESVVNDEYGGGTYTVSLEIRNYENNLLYNDVNMEIPYSLTVWLEEGVTVSPDIKYILKDDNAGAYPLQQGQNNAVTLGGQKLTGGQAAANSYRIEIEVPANSFNDTPPAIYAVAGTDAGSPVKRTLQGKMILQKAAAVEFIESKSFIFPSLPDGAGAEEKLTQAKQLGALTYEIRTVSEAKTSVENLAELKISWRSDKIEIDKFDSNLSNVQSGGGDWYYVTISAIPYSSIQITFFKKDNLQGISTLEELEGLVTVEHVQSQP